MRLMRPTHSPYRQLRRLPGSSTSPSSSLIARRRLAFESQLSRDEKRVARHFNEFEPHIRMVGSSQSTRAGDSPFLMRQQEIGRWRE